MREFLSFINELPEDSILYCAGWWQEPNVTLFLDREMIDMYSDSIHHNDEYFIVGNYINGISKSEVQNQLNAKIVNYKSVNVDYDIYPSQFDRMDLDLFTIYKVDRYD